MPPIPEPATKPEVEGAGMAEGALWITRPSADEGFDPDDPKLLEPLPPLAAAEDDDHSPRANGDKQEEAGEAGEVASHGLAKEPDNKRLPLIQRILPAMTFKRCSQEDATKGRSVLQWMLGARMPDAWKKE
uniref:Uncharacterized protein n=1 Tax=Tetraselmis chuii TaxID=63592 RepID=A0A7S1SSQ3_9CHLO|mmetsp:Transcript_27349/g.48721  ORF Transcript_27349/g.48721 Transcript_27349/m.48721 type:complete len:131 (+) Transcript_27349:267-659(+)